MRARQRHRRPHRTPDGSVSMAPGRDSPNDAPETYRPRGRPIGTVRAPRDPRERPHIGSVGNPQTERAPMTPASEGGVGPFDAVSPMGPGTRKIGLRRRPGPYMGNMSASLRVPVGACPPPCEGRVLTGSDRGIYTLIWDCSPTPTGPHGGRPRSPARGAEEPVRAGRRPRLSPPGAGGRGTETRDLERDISGYYPDSPPDQKCKSGGVEGSSPSDPSDAPPRCDGGRNGPHPTVVPSDGSDTNPHLPDEYRDRLLADGSDGCPVCNSRRIVRVDGTRYCVDCFRQRRYDYVR